MLKFFICFVLFGIVMAYRQVIRQPEAGTFDEIPCLSFGGLCMVANECPDGQLAKSSGLCPVQQHLGVECCHGLPKSERRCKARGGECMAKSECPARFTFSGSVDCEPHQSCCILVTK